MDKNTVMKVKDKSQRERRQESSVDAATLAGRCTGDLRDKLENIHQPRKPHISRTTFK